MKMLKENVKKLMKQNVFLDKHQLTLSERGSKQKKLSVWQKRLQ